MNRFHKQRRRILSERGPLFSFLLLAALILLSSFGIDSFSSSASARQAESLRDAVIRSAVHCYAVEGAYPESLAYLEKHYGITYNKDCYLIDYEVTGSNILPDVTVFLLDEQEVYH